MRRWSIGKISLDREVNNCVTSFKNQHSIIPPFPACQRLAQDTVSMPACVAMAGRHYSMCEAKTQASETSYIFNKL